MHGESKREHEHGVKPDALERRGSGTGKGGCCVSAPAAPSSTSLWQITRTATALPAVRQLIVSFIFPN